MAIVDDHPHVAIALRAMLAESVDIELVGEARRGSETVVLVETTRPTVLLLDLMIEETFDALATVRSLRVSHSHVKICLFSAHIEPTYVRDLLKAGISGYILKDDDYVSRIEKILRDLAAGELYFSTQAYEALAKATRQESEQETLTEREREILRLADRGLRNPQIAQALHLSPGTVRNHLSAIYRKLDVSGRQEALIVAHERKMI